MATKFRAVPNAVGVPTCPVGHNHGARGAVTCYNHHGCRCESCRYARSRFQRDYRRRKMNTTPTVQAYPTMMRMRAMAWLGVTTGQIATALGITQKHAHRVQAGLQDGVYLTLHVATEKLFRETLESPPTKPSPYPIQAAKRNRWVHPLDLDRMPVKLTPVGRANGQGK